MLFKSPSEEKVLRPYQVRAINRLFEEIRAGRKPVCMAPTGAGKGRIIAELAKMGRRKDRRIAICAPMLSLIGQTWRVLADEGIAEFDMGVIQADNPMANASAPIQICSVDTLIRRKVLPDVDLVVFDECFHPDHELWTQRGWVCVADVTEEDHVLAFDADTEICAMEPVLRTVAKEFSGQLVRMKGRHFHTLTTPLHEQPHIGLTGKGRRIGRCEEKKRLPVDAIPASGHVLLPVAAMAKSGQTLSCFEALHIAFQADGHKLYYGKRNGLFTYRFAFRRDRKIQRIEDILDECGIAFKKTENCRRDTVITFQIADDLSKSFEWYDFLESSNRNEQFLQELIEWDGWSNENGCFWEATTEDEAARVQMIAETCGYSSSVNKLKNHDRWRVRWLEKAVWRGGFLKQYEPYIGKVHCVTVNSGNVVTRYRGVVSISGNCHRFSRLYGRWMSEAPQTKFVGFSATPWRADMHKEWDSLVVASTMKELIAEGYLSPYRAFAPSSPDLSGVKIVAGDYHEGQLSEVMQKPKLIADVVNTWREKAAGRPTLVFAVDCAHARLLQEQFHETGTAAGYCDAYTPVEGRGGREELLADLKAGKLNVICNVGTLTTGLDAPFVSCIQLARPTRSEMLYIQIVGRGLRTNPGKEDCLLLDHSDTIKRLGFPDDIHYEDFVRKNEGRAEKQSSGKLPKPCPQCSYLLAPGVRECPACGFVKAAPSSRIVCEDGTLEEVTRGAKKQKQLPLEDKRRWHAALNALALEYGKNDKWVAAHFKEKFGEWPPRYFDSRPGPVDAHIRSWVKSRRIAYAKAMAKKNALQESSYGR